MTKIILIVLILVPYSYTCVSSRSTGYNNAQSREDCQNTFKEAVFQAGSPSCSMITPFFKCLIRVTGFYKYKKSDAEYSSAESEIESGFRSAGLDCNFDIKALAAEVAREQNYRNSESGLHTSVRGMMSLYTVAVAAWICSYFFLQ
ncbi:hypothetical protein BsWGS_09434 [Bradybaena similaris]